MSMPPPPPPPGGGYYQPAPPPGMPTGPTAEERNWALAAHIGTLAAAALAAGASGFIAPLLVLLLKGKESPFVRHHAVESLNFQISLLIYLLISVVLVFVLVGILMLVVVGVFALIAIILGTVAASGGRDFRYPLTIRLIS